MITRFAPSPTGYLHLGHLAHMIYVWGLARRLDARVLFRIEDHDRARCRPEYESAILDDLRWLGLTPDLGFEMNNTSARSPYRQSNCEEAYRGQLDLLARSHRVYACDCSRKQILARTGETTGELRYDNHCRDRGLPLRDAYAWRIALPGGAITFDDGFLGEQHQDPQRQCGDLVVRDREGNWTYQFCVVVDDQRDGIDTVIRGEDILGSTGRQILLARMLGRAAPPRFFHHPLITDTTGRKLSKRDFDEGLRDMRRRGISGPEALGLAAHRLGLLSEPTPLPADELSQLPLL